MTLTDANREAIREIICSDANYNDAVEDGYRAGLAAGMERAARVLNDLEANPGDRFSDNEDGSRYDLWALGLSQGAAAIRADVEGGIDKPISRGA